MSGAATTSAASANSMEDIEKRLMSLENKCLEDIEKRKEVEEFFRSRVPEEKRLERSQMNPESVQKLKVDVQVAIRNLVNLQQQSKQVDDKSEKIEYLLVQQRACIASEQQKLNVLLADMRREGQLVLELYSSLHDKFNPNLERRQMMMEEALNMRVALQEARDRKEDFDPYIKERRSELAMKKEQCLALEEQVRMMGVNPDLLWRD